MHVLRGPVREYHRVAVSPDGEVAACGLGPLRVWRAGRGTDLVREDVGDVTYTPNGRWLLYERAVVVWTERPESGMRTLTGEPDPLNGLYALDRRGDGPAVRLPAARLLAAGDNWLLAGQAASGHVCVCRSTLPAFAVLWELPPGLRVTAAAPLPGGRAAIIEAVGPSRRIVVRDVRTGAELAAAPALDDSYGLLAAPDGRHLVVPGVAGVRVWRTDALAAKPVRVSLGRREVRRLVWHPSGAYLLGVTVAGAVQRVEADGWRLTTAQQFPAGKARAVAVAADGLTAAAATSRGTVVVFDLD